MYCSRCGHEIQYGAAFCAKCGVRIEPQRQNSWNQGQYEGYQIFTSPKPSVPSPKVAAAESKSVASLVMGIISIVTSFFVVGVILGLLAILVGIRARLVLNRSNYRFNIALAGVITGAVGLAISIFFLIYWIVNHSAVRSVPWSYVLY